MIGPLRNGTGMIVAPDPSIRPATASTLQIDIRDKRYPAVGDTPAHTAIRDLFLEVPCGQFVALVGPSGCGKTTTLNIVAGLDRAFTGRIDLPAAGGRTRPVIGYVFQNPRLLPWRTVYANIALALDGRSDPAAVIDPLLAAMELSHVRDQYPTRLSIGMARRVALARAFAVSPDLLLMDEPFVSLDEPTAQRLRALLLEIWNARPTTVLFVTHNLREAIQLADRLVLLSPAPTRVLADLPVTVPRDRRDDEAAIEDFRRELLHRSDPAFRLLA
jgi:ABC-type nitrate/sulfonate/bicarbonate transport system ATPase subunit